MEKHQTNRVQIVVGVVVFNWCKRNCKVYRNRLSYRDIFASVLTFNNSADDKRTDSDDGRVNSTFYRDPLQS